MLFIVHAATFRDAAANAKRSIGKALPALRNVLIEADTDSIALTSTDLERWSSVWVDADVSDGGSFLVDADALVRAAKAAAKREGRTKERTLMVRTEGDSLVIGMVRLPRQNTDDWPAEPTLTTQAAAVLDEDYFKRIARVGLAASGDDARPVLQQILHEKDSDRGGVTLAATDSYRLAWSNGPGPAHEAFPDKWMIPTHAYKMLHKIIGNAQFLQVGRNERGHQDGLIVGDSGALRVRLLEANFPNWRQLMPTARAARMRKAHVNGEETEVEEPAIELHDMEISDRLGLVEGLATMVDLIGTEAKVMVDADDDDLRFSSKDSDGNEVTFEIGYKGDPIEDKVCFNGKYLLDGVNFAAGGAGTTITIRHNNDPKKPIMLTSCPDTADHFSITDEGYLLMPVRL